MLASTACTSQNRDDSWNSFGDRVPDRTERPPLSKRLQSETASCLDQQLHGIDVGLAHERHGKIDVQHVAETGARVAESQDRCLRHRASPVAAPGEIGPQVRPASANTAAPTLNNRNGYQSV